MLIRPLTNERCRLGEGPLWDAATQSLFWVDSLGPRLLRYEFSTGRVSDWRLPGSSVGSLAVVDDKRLLVARDQGFYFFDLESEALETIFEPIAGRPDLRFNDGKVDCRGAFVAGTMNRDFRRRENCAMYRLTPDLRCDEILDGFFCFNGPCFDAAGKTLYLTGREDGLIEAFDYDPAAAPANGRRLRQDCNPDGATVDRDGYLWSAQWDDACLLRISPGGEIDYRLEIPGQIASSVMFGGPRMDLIFVTTVGGEVNGVCSDSEDAGKLLVIEGSGFRGRAEPRFGDQWKNQ